MAYYINFEIMKTELKIIIIAQWQILFVNSGNMCLKGIALESLLTATGLHIETVNATYICLLK